MPYGEPDFDDPNEIIGVELDGNPETTEEMAYVFAEEFTRLGFSKEKLMFIFKLPFYASAYKAYNELGEEKISTIIDECSAIWNRN
ncbi:hypothetical protein IT568_04290 [bacterium]|nr:hypothetical protein [bacterium]